MDADSGAIGQGIAKLIGRITDVKNQRKDWQFIYSDPQKAIFTWIFAIYSLVWLFGVERFNLANLSSGDHPEPRLRQILNFSTIWVYFNREQIQATELTDQLRMLLKQSVSDVVPQVEMAFHIITGSPMHLEGAINATDPKIHAHIDMLLENWKVMRPKLLPFSRAKLAI